MTALTRSPESYYQLPGNPRDAFFAQPGDMVDGRLIHHFYLSSGVWMEPGEFYWAEFEHAEIFEVTEFEQHNDTGELIAVLYTSMGVWAVPADLMVLAEA